MEEAKVTKKGISVSVEVAESESVVKAGKRVISTMAFLRSGKRVKDQLVITEAVANRFDRTPAPKKKKVYKQGSGAQVVDQEATNGSDELEGLKVDELKAMAKDLEVEGYSSMKKDQLVAAVREAQTEEETEE